MATELRKTLKHGHNNSSTPFQETSFSPLLGGWESNKKIHLVNY